MVSLSLSFPQKLALFTQKSYSPTNLSNIYFSPTTVNSKQKDVTGPPHSLMWGGGCQDMLRWSGQNANQKVDPDKMPTTEKKSRTKCQPRLAFCPVGISSGWHFVHTPCLHLTRIFPAGYRVQTLYLSKILDCRIYRAKICHRKIA